MASGNTIMTAHALADTEAAAGPVIDVSAGRPAWVCAGPELLRDVHRAS